MLYNNHVLEITSTCNLRCPFCVVNHGMRRPNQIMTFDDIKYILGDLLPENGTRHVS